MQKNFQMIILLLVLTIGLLITYNINIIRHEISENQYNTLVNELRRDTTSFGLWVNEKTSILNAAKEIASNFNIEQLKSHKTDNPYLNINRNNPYISAIYIGFSDGGFVTGGQWVPPSDYDPRTRTWYIEAYEAQETIISTPYIDRESGEPVITISSPLYLDELFVGVISADVFLTDIKQFLMTQIEKGISESTLIDENGTILINTRKPELEGQNLYTDVDLPVLIDFFDKAKKTGDLVRLSYSFEGNKIIGIVQKVYGRNWYLAVTRSEQTSLVNIIKSHASLLMINALILIIILYLIYIIIKRRLELFNDNQLLRIENELDYLTGIYNRRYFNLHMEKLWQRTDIDQLSLVILDVDFFKSYNDSYGHLLGDEVLKSLTHCIQNSIRKNDVFARFGGEEFAIILENVDQATTETIANKIIEAVYNLNIEHTNSPFGRITISIGAVTVEDRSKTSIREAVDHADKTLYKAKDKGRNRLVYYQKY